MNRMSFRAALMGTAAVLVASTVMPAVAQAQAPGGGSFSNSILIPGSNTSFKVGGYVKLDYTYDFGVTQNSVGGLAISAIPLDANIPGTVAGAGHSIGGASQCTASESRFNIETRTPSAYGEFKTFIEGDFTNPSGLTNGATFRINSNSSGFRLRLAYGTLGPFLAGQTASNFRDTLAEPETLDFGGAFGAGALRQPQFRYTYDVGNGLLIAGAAENPQNQFISAATGTSSTTFSTGQADKLPDFTGAVTWVQPWGHLSFRTVVRDLDDHNGSNLSLNTFGWGLGASGDLRTWGKDDLVIQANGGDGIGRYSNTIGLVQDTVVNPATNTLENLKIVSGLIGYQHWWTDQLRTNVDGSYLHVGYPNNISGAALLAQNRDLLETHVNLIWSPIPQVDLGGEYIWGRRRAVNGQEGFANRLQLSSKFKF